MYLCDRVSQEFVSDRERERERERDPEKDPERERDSEHLPSTNSWALVTVRVTAGVTAEGERVREIIITNYDGV